jgi:hypothetical protein
MLAEITDRRHRPAPAAIAQFRGAEVRCLADVKSVTPSITCAREDVGSHTHDCDTETVGTDWKALSSRAGSARPVTDPPGALQSRALREKLHSGWVYDEGG